MAMMQNWVSEILIIRLSKLRQCLMNGAKMTIQKSVILLKNSQVMISLD